MTIFLDFLKFKYQIKNIKKYKSDKKKLLNF